MSIIGGFAVRQEMGEMEWFRFSVDTASLLVAQMEGMVAMAGMLFLKVRPFLFSLPIASKIGDKNIKDLSHLHSVTRGDSGEFGGSKSCHGKSAEHTEGRC